MIRFIQSLATLFILAFSINTYANESTQKINLIWQFDEQHRCEEDWLLDLFSYVDVNVISDGNYEVFLDRSVVIVSYWFGREHHNAYFAKLRDLGYKFAVVHLSDEFYYADTTFYSDAEFVLRSYWHKKFLGQENVFTLPLGYKAGFWREQIPEGIKSPAERSYTWCFAGQINNKPTRVDMINSLKHVEGYYIYETNTWADPNGLGTIAYRDMLLNSIFAPCPTGFWNLDSFRSSEAFECGCIPIVEKGPNNYFDKLYGDHPCIVVESWDQAPAIMQELLDDPEKLEARHNACVEWWDNYKMSLRTMIKELVDKYLLD